MKRRHAAMAALSMLAAVALAACGSTGGGTGSSTNGASIAVTPAATKDVGALTWWQFSRPIFTLDPVKFNDYPEDTIIPNLCESLARVQPGMKVVPGLAASWTQPDPLTLVYTLRSGVKFWDGSPLTAQDAAYSMNRNRDPKNASIYAGTYSDVDSVAATGPLTVTVKLKRPSTLFPEQMATAAGAVVQKAYAEEKGAQLGTPHGGVMCTGPYKVKSWNGSDSLTIERSSNYWNADMQPKAASIKFVAPQDPATVSNGFSTGAFDGGFGIPASMISTLQQTDAGKLWVASPDQSQVIDAIAVINKDGALGSQAVREALSKSIDRRGIAATAWFGEATALHSYAPPAYWTYGRDAFAAAYEKLAAQDDDVAGAKKLVAGAGAVAQKPIVLAIDAGFPTSVEEASVIKQTAAQAGLNVEIRALPIEQFGALFSDLDAGKKQGIDALLTLGYNQIADPLAIYEDIARPGGGSNFTGYDNPQVTKLLLKAQGQADPDARAQTIIQAQALVMQDLPWIPVTTPRLATFQKTGITGAPVDFSYMTSPWAAEVGAP